VRKLVDSLFHPVDAASLGAFRILFGALMLYEVAYGVGGIRRTYLEARILFPFEFFPFVRPWPGPWMYVHFALMGVAALGLMLGLFYRLSAAAFLVGYVYVFLLDKGEYNNHYYFIALLSFLFLVVRGQRWASLDQWRRPRPEVVPYWNLLLFRAQVFLVFFYGGVAKLNGDWFAGEPMRTWLAEMASTPVIGPWLATAGAAYFFSYGGMLFDLAIGFLLLSRRTLPIAIAGMLAFNLTNHWLFSIGVFPFLMLACLVLFAPPDLPRRFLRLGAASPAGLLESGAGERPAWVVPFVVLYLAVQVLLPLRHWLYRGEVSWTEEGHRFAWHMKVRSKKGQVRFRVTDPATGETWNVDPGDDLNPRQRRKLVSPDILLQYAHVLRDRYAARGVREPIVQVDTVVSLNRRPPQALIDPAVNLATVEASVFRSADWIVPLDQSGRPGTISLGAFGSLGVRKRSAPR
jgi:vitamin K-dependent gamma-carboxylase